MIIFLLMYLTEKSTQADQRATRSQLAMGASYKVTKLLKQKANELSKENKFDIHDWPSE